MPIRYLIAALVALICAVGFGLTANGWSPWLQFAATVAGILLVGAIAFPRDLRPGRHQH